MTEKVLKDGRVKVRLDCRCGSAIEISGPDDGYVREMVDWFTHDHAEQEGHGLCTVKESAAARRREQRQQMSEWRNARA